MFAQAVVSDSATLWTAVHQAPLSMVFSRQKVVEWVPISYSRESSRFRDQTLSFCISCIASSFFTTALPCQYYDINTILSLHSNFANYLSVASFWSTVQPRDPQGNQLLCHQNLPQSRTVSQTFTSMRIHSWKIQASYSTEHLSIWVCLMLPHYSF